MGLGLYYNTDRLLYEDAEEGKVYDKVYGCHFSYFGFMRYRELLFGFIDDRPLTSMFGYCQDAYTCPAACKKCEKINKWGTVKSNLKIILDHSDCDGEIKLEDLKLLLPELEKIVLPVDNDYYDSHKELIDLIRCCIANDSDLMFG